jgi:hypothetical protein
MANRAFPTAAMPESGEVHNVSDSSKYQQNLHQDYQNEIRKLRKPPAECFDTAVKALQSRWFAPDIHRRNVGLRRYYSFSFHRVPR